MKHRQLVTLFLTTTLVHAVTRESNRQSEQSVIPDRADPEERTSEEGKKKSADEKKEVRENQEDTDPVFYDSTTSPQEMGEEKL